VTGSVAPDTVNPVPLTVAELTVSAADPVDVSMIDCATGVFTTTEPNPIAVAFRLIAATAGFSCNEIAFEELPVLDVTVAVCAVLTHAAFAIKVAVLVVAGTVIEVGTVTALLLLARFTTKPPVGADPDKLTVQASVVDPVIEVLLQVIPLIVGVTVVPFPLMLTVTAGALLAMVNCPLTAPAEIGLN
jgi:hypothetical protein